MTEQFIKLDWKQDFNGYTCAIVGVGMKPANQFMANPYNPKYHPKKQRAAVDASLRKWGWSGFVAENVNTGNMLDGHDRVFEAMAIDEETPVPYILLDVPPGEEAEFLIAFDGSGRMAKWDFDKLLEMREDGLLENVMPEFDLAGIFSNVQFDYDNQDDDEEEEEEQDNGMIMYFFFPDKEEFKRVHRKLVDYEFDGEGMSVSLQGEILSDLIDEKTP